MDVLLVGAGSRGRDTFGSYALRHPERMRVVAFAEPDETRREVFATAHRIPEARSFRDWRPLLEAGIPAPAAIVATGDALHTGPALAALRGGYHLLLEKPMALRLDECEAIVRAAEQTRRILQIGHVLRYTPFYRKIWELAVRDRVLGEIQTISMAEHVAHWHFTHSYVRGRWRSQQYAAPLILAKCCHDLDLMSWFVGRRCLRVASFGELAHYRPERAPKDAAARCSDACPAEPDCPHSAPRFYAHGRSGWPWNDVSLTPTREARIEALATGPYGVCVYAGGNDQPDRQSVLLEFEGGIQGRFEVDGFAARPERSIRIQGTRGELRGRFEARELEVRDYQNGDAESHLVEAVPDGHGGGDQGLLDHFTDVTRREARGEVLASGRAALESHRLGFAAELARREGRAVALEELG